MDILYAIHAAEPDRMRKHTHTHNISPNTMHTYLAGARALRYKRSSAAPYNNYNRKSSLATRVNREKYAA